MNEVKVWLSRADKVLIKCCTIPHYIPTKYEALLLRRAEARNRARYAARFNPLAVNDNRNTSGMPVDIKSITAGITRQRGFVAAVKNIKKP